MRARVHADWAFRGIDALTLENSVLRVDILTGLGAKIYNLIDLPTGKNLLWHNPRRLPVPSPFGANFDNYWSGGWDEPFPNGAETFYHGDVQPFLGELWTLPWRWEVVEDGPDAAVHLWADGVITPARVEKWVRLDRSRPVLTFEHRITNTGHEPFDFMWGIHPALDVVAGQRIDLPARKVTVEESRDGKLGVPNQTFNWPFARDTDDTPIDLQLVMEPSARTYGLLYAHELTDGWIAVTDPEGGPSFALAFPHDVFQSVWLWLVYGGWRGLYHIAVEPWTGYPSDIGQAATAGRTRWLDPGESLEATVTAVVYRGLTRVTAVSPAGEVSGEREEEDRGRQT